MKRTLIATALLLPVLLNGCGDDEDSSADDAASDTETLSADQQAVKEVLVESLLDPRCDLLTDDYLLELALFAESADEACEERQNVWVEPQFEEDDILITDIVVTGDEASAVVGSEYVNLTTTYELTRVDGAWRVSCDDITCDLEASPEVS